MSELRLRDENGALAVMASVYSVPFPETAATFSAFAMPPSLYAVSAPRAAFDEFLASEGLDPLPDEGERKLGLLDLLHVPACNGIVRRLARSILGIDDPAFLHRYPLHGSAWGVTLLMWHLRMSGVSRVHVRTGDYEGYAANARNAGLELVTHPLEALADLAGEVVFLSAPSAVDGAPVSPGLTSRIAERNRLVLDVAYHGLAGQIATVVPQNTWAVLWSLSKPWGLFWRRVGMLLCRDEIPGAYGTRWYKDPERLLAAHAVVREHAPSAAAERIRPAQRAALSALRDAGLNVDGSPTVLLALARRQGSDPALWAEVEKAERIPGCGIARLCISPLLEQIVLADAPASHAR